MGPSSEASWHAFKTSKQGAERSRELYKYFRPADFTRDESVHRPTSPDTLLTAQAQLVAWRLDARRCTIGFIDHAVQYNVAEGTKTLHLDNTAETDDPDDSLWSGCNPTSAQDSICLKTLQAIAGSDGAPACFEVPDLQKDERFAWLPFVANNTIRYYYGAPLRTKRGITIGAICVLDDKLRPLMTESQKEFMNVIADNVITHLSLLRERVERRRGLNMNRCLNLFINPEGPVKMRESLKSQPMQGPTKLRPMRGPPSALLDKQGVTGPPSDAQRPSKREEVLDQTRNPTPSTPRPSQDGYHREANDNEHMLTYKNAARLLHESLELFEGGGVVFMDTTASARTALEDSDASETNSEDEPSSSRRESVIGVGNEPIQNDYERPRERRRRLNARSGSAEILASSTTLLADLSDSDSPIEPRTGQFSPLSLDAIKNLIKRYPRGQLWSLAMDGQLCSDSDEEQEAEQSEQKYSAAQNQSDANLLLAHFPGACQLIFLPLWDARTSRWSVCIAYSTSMFRNFTYDTDFVYAIAFCNCISTEMARMNVSAADHQKGDFIGSISHELRSPLHGILASCEFLQDIETNAFQQSLVDTVDSCARTLLDTISQILDFSKINTFERDHRKVKRKKASLRKNSSQLNSQAAMSEAPPLLNIYGDVDIATITEEVVEGVTTGQVLRDIATLTFPTDEPKASRETETHSTSQPASSSVYGNSKVKLRSYTPAVEIILDIAPGEWRFLTQPGAFRRIVMNIVGNALKYTEKGWVKVQLKILSHQRRKSSTTSAGNDRGSDSSEMIQLIVEDTGRGISPEYLRTNLFTPFSQESTLSPGAGLGLALVRSILDMMNATIDLKSTLGVGTQVTIQIPMMRHNNDGSTSDSTPSTAGVREDSVSILKEITRHLRIDLYHQRHVPALDLEQGAEARKMMRSTIAACVRNWYALPNVAEFKATNHGNVVITDEVDLHALLAIIPGGLTSKDRPAIVVLCSNASRHGHLRPFSNSGRIAFVSKPFGPQKLAKALLICIRPEAITPHHAILGGSEVQNEVEEVTSSLDHVTLAVAGRAINVLGSHGTLGNDQTPNARLALEEHPKVDTPAFNHVSWSLPDASPGDFPFPHAGGDVGVKSLEPETSLLLALDNEGVITPTGARRPSLNTRRTMSGPVNGLERWQQAETQSLNSSLTAMAALVQPAALVAETTTRPPRLLVVDDNNVNLRLLQTFMKKRKYNSVLSAMDGKQAADAFESALVNGEPPDIIFMDISMPIMNGFEATKAIRAIEREHHSKLSPMETPPQALIIALTGLASGRDQSEAFSVGMDLYITKPVSFKEVGRLLDNWEANGGGGAEDHVPHGSAVGKQ